MPTNNYSEICYFCGGTAYLCQDTKPPSLDYECMSCGTFNIIKWDKMSLEDVNAWRFDNDLPELKKLKEMNNEL